MIFNNPGTDRIPLFGGCACFGFFEILIKPYLVTPFRGTDGRAPHLLYQVSGTGSLAEYQEPSNHEVQGSFVDADKTFTVEFDGGGFSLNTAGSLYLTGGDPTGQCEVRFLHHLHVGNPLLPPPLDIIPPVVHWHGLTTAVPTATTMLIPDYHSRVSGWAAAAGVTLEGVAIDLPAYPVRCIPGTTLSNARGVTLMVATEWWG